MGGYGQGASAALGERRRTRGIRLGNVPIGGGAPIAVQSMTTTQTADAAATLAQIRALAEAGADVVRLAVPDADAAAALPAIVRASPVPLVADIHFDYRLALAALEAGIQGIRLNPGNIGAPRAGARGGEGGARAARADPHRRERGLAREGHRREARLAHRGGHGRERRAAHPLPRGRGLPRDQGLAEGARRRHDGAGEPAVRGAARLPAPPRRHRGRHAPRRHREERRRPRHPARRGDRRHDPRLAHRRSRRGGAGRAPAPQVARPQVRRARR